MKRILWLSLLVGALLIVGATVALAQDDAGTPAPAQAVQNAALPAPDVRPGFVDADGDGVCDNCGQGLGNPNAPRPNFVDEDGDGVCDNCAAGGQGRRGPRAGYGSGANFVDEDGDGVCDNCGQGLGNPNAPRPNFIDADGDGVCDNMGANGGQGRQMGQGAGRGFRGGRGG